MSGRSQQQQQTHYTWPTLTEPTWLSLLRWRLRRDSRASDDVTAHLYKHKPAGDEEIIQTAGSLSDTRRQVQRSHDRQHTPPRLFSTWTDTDGRFSSLHSQDEPEVWLQLLSVPNPDPYSVYISCHRRGRTDTQKKKVTSSWISLRAIKKPDSRPVHSDIGCVSLAHIAASPLIHQWLSESTRRDPEQDLHIQRHLTRFPVLSQLLFSFCHRHQWNNTKYLYTHFRLWKPTLTLTVHTQTIQLWLQHSLH